MKANLKKVYTLAFTDREFLRKLRKSPGRALRSAGITLSKEEKSELLGDLNAQYVITGWQYVVFAYGLMSDIRDLLSQKLGPPPPPPPPFRRLVAMRKK